jgi:hypothetical protein
VAPLGLGGACRASRDLRLCGLLGHPRRLHRGRGRGRRRRRESPRRGLVGGRGGLGGCNPRHRCGGHRGRGHRKRGHRERGRRCRHQGGRGPVHQLLRVPLHLLRGRGLLPVAMRGQLQLLQPVRSRRSLHRRGGRHAAAHGSSCVRNGHSGELRTRRHVRRERTVRSLEQRRLQDGELRRDQQRGDRGLEVQRPGHVRDSDAGHLRSLSVRPDRYRLLHDVHGVHAVRLAQPVRRRLLRDQGERRGLHEQRAVHDQQLRRRLLLRWGVHGRVPGVRCGGHARGLLPGHLGPAARDS